MRTVCYVRKQTRKEKNILLTNIKATQEVKTMLA